MLLPFCASLAVLIFSSLSLQIRIGLKSKMQSSLANHHVIDWTLSHACSSSSASLLKDIMEKSIFGAAVTYVYTIEYQKWGLPHMHLIVFMDPLAHLSMPSCVDSHISAEFPDEDAEPILFDLVKMFMVHGPCIRDQCLNDKNCCMKGFPKPFQPETEFSSQSYVKLR